jgi:hypothetical protein
MTTSRVRPALVIWLLAMLALVVSGWILLPFPRRPTGWEEIAWAIGFGAGFTSVGALLVDRRPHEPVSRITLGVGLMVVASISLRAAVVWLDARPGELPPVAGVAVLASEALTSLAFIAASGFLLVRFPDGRHQDRLSALVDALVVLMVLTIVLQAFLPGPIETAWIFLPENPIGIAALQPMADSAVGGVGLGLYAGSLLLAVIAVASRYRLADAVVRAQVRWVAAAGAVPMLLVPFILVADWLWTLWFLSSMLLPFAIGIALLRYRLFDIDRIIGRTIAYAVITAILAAVFVVANLALVRLFAEATRSNTLIVAASTLLVAALFQPIRRRVQAPIDRRFNRAHLDSERVVGAFARRTRDEVDLAKLRDAVVLATVESMDPSGATLWLRRDELHTANDPAGGATAP